MFHWVISDGGSSRVGLGGGGSEVGKSHGWGVGHDDLGMIGGTR